MRLRTSVYLLAACSLLAYGGYVLSGLQPDLRPKRVASRAGTDEDPHARARFDWMRLRDPATGRIPEGIRERELGYARMISLTAGKTSGRQALPWLPRGPFNQGGRTRALAIDRTDDNVILAGGVSGGMWRTENGGQSWTKVTAPSQQQSVTCIVQDPRPGKDHVWYYGSGEAIGNSATAPDAFLVGNGLYRSTDRGLTWSRFAFGDDTPHTFSHVSELMYEVAVDASNTASDEIYVATYGAVYRSTPGATGLTFQAVLVSLEGSNGSFSYSTDVAVAPTGMAYATMSSDGTKDGIFRSPTGTSADWTEITPPGFPQTFGRIEIALAPSNPNVVYFLAVTPGTGATGHSLWKYTHNGTGGSWEDRTANLPTASRFPVNSLFGNPNFGAFDAQGGYDLVVSVKPDDENVVFIGGTNLYRSTDGFATANNVHWIGGYHPQTFRYPEENPHHPDQHAIAFFPSNPRRMITGTDGGLYRTDDNLSVVVQNTPVRWTSLNNGYITTQFYSIAIDHATPSDNTIIGGMQDNGTLYTGSPLDSEPWVGDWIGGDGAHCDIDDGRNFYYVSAQNAIIFRLQLNAQGEATTFARVDPADDDAGEFLFITPFALDPVDQSRMFLGGGDALWRNHDLHAIPNGNQQPTRQNWTRVTETALLSGNVTAVAPTPLRSGAVVNTRLYFSTFFQRNDSSLSAIFRIDDAWADEPTILDVTPRGGSGTSTGDPFPVGGYISNITVDPADPDNVLVVFSNYMVESLFYTSDAGLTWTAVGGNLEGLGTNVAEAGPSARWAEIVPLGAGQRLYLVATSTGVYSTNQLSGDQTVWLPEGEQSIGNVVVDMIDSRPVDGQIVAATHGNGVFSSRAPVETSTRGETVPDRFRLSPAYPNPFNPRTNFSLAVAEAQHVRVEVFDLQGRRVSTLHDAPLEGGRSHRFTFEAGELPSGLYIYRATGERFEASGRMLLVK